MKPTDRPKPIARDYAGLALTPEEGFVLSRIDGRLSMKDIVDLTGIEPERVDHIVSNLAQKGVVAVPALAPPPADLVASVPPRGAVVATPMSPDDETLPELEIVDDEPHDGGDDLAAALAFARTPSAPPAEAAAPAELEEVTDEAGETPAELSYEKAAYEREEKRASTLPPAPEDEAATAEGEEGEPVASEAEPEEATPDEAKVLAEPHTYRQIYEAKFRGLEPGARASAALAAVGADLYALCFDPDPKVIQAVLQNARVGLAHARFVASWHSTSAGLEYIGTRNEFFRDSGVQRRLLRNTHLSESFLKRIIQPKRLGEIFKACMDKDVPQLTRTRARGILRQKFTGMAQPEERTELIVQTEGRCLPLLVGCTFDGRTTQMLCSRQYNSMIFVQNLAKFPATPPTLLAHLIKQPSVRRNQGIKRMLLQHKNMPSEAKKYG